jgi:S-adenosylmethionine/arginine decarboxylase-like enzyme
MELQSCPTELDKEKVSHMIDSIIHDIGMKSLASPHVYYMKYPRFNEGLTGIAPIETSHIAFHFWTRPDPKILHTAKSKCLLEFDIYTCGTLTTRQVGRVLHHLTTYRPTYADITILNRNWGLTIDRHMHWSCEQNDLSWVEWLNTPTFN